MVEEGRADRPGEKSGKSERGTALDKRQKRAAFQIAINI